MAGPWTIQDSLILYQNPVYLLPKSPLTNMVIAEIHNTYMLNNQLKYTCIGYLCLFINHKSIKNFMET